MVSTKPTVVLVGEDNIDLISMRKQIELKKGSNFVVESRVLGFEELFDFIRNTTESLLVLLDMSRNPEKASWIAQEVKREFPDIYLVMTATDNHPATISRAKRSGAEDFLLLQPLKWVEVFQSLDKIMEKMRREDRRPGDRTRADSGPQTRKAAVKAGPSKNEPAEPPQNQTKTRKNTETSPKEDALPPLHQPDAARTDAASKGPTERPGTSASLTNPPAMDKPGVTSGLVGEGPGPEPGAPVASSQKSIDGRDGLMQGLFSQIRVIDVLQLAILAKKSGLLKLTRGKEIVDVFIVRGEIIHAVSPIGQGEKALFYPLTWTEGTFALMASPSTPQRTIPKLSPQLLSELLAVNEEWEQVRQALPPEGAVFCIGEAEKPDRQTQPVTFSPDEWTIFTKIDGSRSVRSIAEILHLPYFDVAKTIYKFQRGELVKAASPLTSLPSPGPPPPSLAPPAAPRGTGPVRNGVPTEFFKRMIEGLAEVLGPISPIVVRNQIAALGESLDTFPGERLGELIDSVSQQIQDKKQRTHFLEKMREEIRALKAS